MGDTDNKPTFSAQELALVGDAPGDRKTELLSKIGSDQYTDQDAQELASLMSGKAPARKAVERSEADEAFEDVVPEDASGYDVPARPDGEPRSELDLKLIDQALERFHEAGFTRAQAAAAIAALDAAEEEVARLHDETADGAHEEAMTALREEWGARFDDEVERANKWIRAQLNSALANRGGTKALMQARLPSGERLGDLAGFVRWANAMAKRVPAAGKDDDGDDEDEEPPTYTPTGLESLVRRRDALLRLMHTDEKAYARAQPELQRIIAQLNERGAG